MLRGTLITAALVVFVDCMKELPATLILRPFNYETLATYVYQFASDEQLYHSALPALIIVLAGIIPIILMNRSISNSRSMAYVRFSTGAKNKGPAICRAFVVHHQSCSRYCQITGCFWAYQLSTFAW